jgi:hypothetical protein
MTTAIIERSPSIDLVPRETHADPASREDNALPAGDMRRIGLGRSGRLLGMQVADLGPLQVRRAKADLVHCPICPGH